MMGFFKVAIRNPIKNTKKKEEHRDDKSKAYYS